VCSRIENDYGVIHKSENLKRALIFSSNLLCVTSRRGEF
jgi:hypothetical protein